MNSKSNNPWHLRFLPFLNREYLKQLATVKPAPLENLYGLPKEYALKLLENSLENVFYPSEQCLNVLEKLIGMCHAHYLINYRDTREFLGYVYSDEPPFSDFYPPLCITGLAGVGKSKILQIFIKIISNEISFIADNNHTPFVMKNPWIIKVSQKKSLNDIFKHIVGDNGKLQDNKEKARNIAYLDSVPMMIADEFQFVTSSANANTVVTQMLLGLGEVGIPYIFAANFDLIKKLLKRADQDQQRILAETIVIVPDPWNSTCWKNHLKSLFEIAPDIFNIDIENDGWKIHSFVAGRKRALAKLFKIAFSLVHGKNEKIDISILEKAYNSSDFSNYREESIAISNQFVLNKPDSSRPYLWCPIPLPESISATFTRQAKENREKVIADMAIRSSLNKEEREAAENLQKQINKNKDGENVIRMKKSTNPTAKEFVENARKFRDSL